MIRNWTTARRHRTRLVVAALVAASAVATSSPAQAAQQPPYSGSTAFIDPDIITDADPSDYRSVRGLGDDRRRVWDAADKRVVVVDVWLYRLTFADGDTTEVLTTKAFTSAQGRTEAVRYGRQLGRIPATLRRGVDKLTIYRGDHNWTSSTRTVNIYTGSGARYARLGAVAEVLVHEGAHAALSTHTASPGWKAAQQADPGFISVYARDNAATEDIAESALLAMAVRHRPGRLSGADRVTIRSTMPNRIASLAGLGLAPPVDR